MNIDGIHTLFLINFLGINILTGLNTILPMGTDNCLDSSVVAESQQSVLMKQQMMMVHQMMTSLNVQKQSAALSPQEKGKTVVNDIMSTGSDLTVDQSPVEIPMNMAQNDNGVCENEGGIDLPEGQQNLVQNEIIDKTQSSNNQNTGEYGF